MKNIVFFLNQDVGWNCFKKIYEYCEKAEDLNPKVIVLDNHWDENQVKLLKTIKVNYVTLSSISQESRIKYLQSLSPEIIFCHVKDDLFFKKTLGLTFEEMSKLFNLVYIPYYGTTIVDYQEEHCERPGHRFCWKIIADSKEYEDMLLKSGIEKERIINLGHPKIVEIFETRNKLGKWVSQDFSKLKVIWSPHWSIPEFETWKTQSKNYTKFSTFLKIKDDFLKFVEKNKDIHVVFRPHPLLRIATNELKKTEEYEKFLKDWDSNSNASLQLDGDYLDTFAASDVMVTDGASFLTEYPIATSKPLIFIDSQVHYPFNEIGKVAEKYSNKVTTFEEVERFLLNPTLLKTDKQAEESLINTLIPNREKTIDLIMENVRNSLRQ